MSGLVGEVVSERVIGRVALVKGWAGVGGWFGGWGVGLGEVIGVGVPIPGEYIQDISWIW